MRNLLRHLLFAGTVAAAAAAAGEITFWDAPGFAGRSFSANQAISNFADVGFNDRAVSAIVRGGTWQLCGDAYFRGRCVTLGPGQYPDLAAVGLVHAISSARELTGWPGGGAAGGGGRVVLYDSSGFIGATYDVNGAVVNFDGIGFNDRALSMVVHEGTWELCVDANFEGYCQTFGPGRYANLGRLSRLLSSLRPVGGGGGGGGVPEAAAGGATGRARSSTKAPTSRAARSSSTARSCPTSTARGSTIARRRCASRAATGSSAATRISTANAGRSAPATTRPCPGRSTTGSRRAGASAGVTRTTRRRTGRGNRPWGSSTTSPGCAASWRARA